MKVLKVVGLCILAVALSLTLNVVAHYVVVFVLSAR